MSIRRGLHHGLELRPVSVLARLLIDVFADNDQAFLGGELPQLDQLVLGVLPSVLGAHPSIEHDSLWFHTPIVPYTVVFCTVPFHLFRKS